MSTPLPADELLPFWVKGSHIQAVVLLFGSCWWPSSPSGPSGSLYGYRHCSVLWQRALLPLCSAGCLLPLCHPLALDTSSSAFTHRKSPLYYYCAPPREQQSLKMRRKHLFCPTSLRVVSSNASYGSQPPHRSPRPSHTAAAVGLHKNTVPYIQGCFLH